MRHALRRLKRRVFHLLNFRRIRREAALAKVELRLLYELMKRAQELLEAEPAHVTECAALDDSTGKGYARWGVDLMIPSATVEDWMLRNDPALYERYIQPVAEYVAARIRKANCRQLRAPEPDLGLVDMHHKARNERIGGLMYPIRCGESGTQAFRLEMEGK